MGQREEICSHIQIKTKPKSTRMAVVLDSAASYTNNKLDVPCGYQLPCAADVRNNVHQQVNNDDLPSMLNSIQNLLVKYRMYSSSSDSQVTSGGLQQFISRKLREKSASANKTNTDSWSWTQRLRAIYTREPQSVSFALHDGDGGSFFQCLPVRVS